jgi:hypothetical protein
MHEDIEVRGVICNSYYAVILYFNLLKIICPSCFDLFECFPQILMDSNYIDILSLQTELNLLRSEIQSVEDSVYLRLDTSRNRLLIANTQIAALAAAIGMGAFIGSLFGAYMY